MFEKMFDIFDELLDETSKLAGKLSSTSKSLGSNYKKRLDLCYPGTRIKFLFMNKENEGTVISSPFTDLNSTRLLIAVKLDKNLKIITKAKSWSMERVIISVDAIYV